MSEKCAICGKEIDEFGIFWLTEVEFVDKLLASNRKEVKICPEHVSAGIRHFHNKLKKKEWKNTAWS